MIAVKPYPTPSLSGDLARARDLEQARGTGQRARQAQAETRPASAAARPRTARRGAAVPAARMWNRGCGGSSGTTWPGPRRRRPRRPQCAPVRAISSGFAAEGYCAGCAIWKSPCPAGCASGRKPSMPRSAARHRPASATPGFPMRRTSPEHRGDHAPGPAPGQSGRDHGNSHRPPAVQRQGDRGAGDAADDVLPSAPMFQMPARKRWPARGDQDQRRGLDQQLRPGIAGGRAEQRVPEDRADRRDRVMPATRTAARRRSSWPARP